MYVQYLHPSDAAAEVDWNKVAVRSILRVRNKWTPEELEQDLNEMSVATLRFRLTTCHLDAGCTKG